LVYFQDDNTLAGTVKTVDSNTQFTMFAPPFTFTKLDGNYATYTKTALSQAAGLDVAFLWGIDG